MADAPLDGSASSRLTLFMLHFLGGGAGEWDHVTAQLSGEFDVVAVDLPGFGSAKHVGAWSVEDMAARLAQTVRDRAPQAWIIVGHSMGAKIAAIVGRQAENGASGLAGLSGLIFLAGSPPGPEPMDETTRNKMLKWFLGTPEKSRQQAETFIRDNAASTLAKDDFERAVRDVLSCEPAAWRAWLERGSREDWSSYVGVLDTPTLLVAGGEDGPLGPAAQQDSARRHFSNAQVVTISGAKHLLPIEAPAQMADLVSGFWRTVAARQSSVPADYLHLIRSDRTSARTRRILLDRLSGAKEEPCMPPAQFRCLEALIDRIVPQGVPHIPLAHQVAASLMNDAGDGWRYADLPSDTNACRLGLQMLDEAASAESGSLFADLDPARQDAFLARAAGGSLRGALDPDQMRRWFEDVCAAAVRVYVSDPATLARIGYGGFANGGDGKRKQGFSILQAGERERWEPVGEVVL